MKYLEVKKHHKSQDRKLFISTFAYYLNDLVKILYLVGNVGTELRPLPIWRFFQDPQLDVVWQPMSFRISYIKIDLLDVKR